MPLDQQEVARRAYQFAYDNGERTTNNALAGAAGNMLARGDQTGAQNLLFKFGRIEDAQKLQDRDAATRQQQAQALEKLTTGMANMMADPQYQGNANAVWQAAHAAASRLGIDPTVLDKHEQDYARDPRGFVTYWNGAAKDELKVYQSGGHIRGLDPRSGKEVWAYDMPADPRTKGVPQGFRVNPDTGDLEIDPGYLAGKAALSKATRAPPRGRSGGGRGGGGGYPGLPPGYRPK